MGNSFSKEEKVQFENLLEGFHDALVLSHHINIFNTNQQEMERQNDIIWRPQPYISQSFNGTDQTANFKEYTQMSVPATIGFNKSVPWILTATELRDALQEQRLGESAKQKLASDINVAINTLASNSGTLVVKRTTAAAGFDDVAQMDAIMNEQGIEMNDRYFAVSTRDYNSMASNLAGRQTMQGRPETAYDRAYIGTVASFESVKMDYTPRLALAAASNVTINGDQYYVPAATSVATTGEVSNVDNRYMNLSVTVGSGTIKVGDCFTISASNPVDAVHHITKGDTGQLKTFRVTGIISGAGGTGVIQISPPIIAGANGGGSDAEIIYQNCSDKAVSGATVTFLNTAAAYANPFWHKDALEMLPGRFAVPADAGTAVIRGTTDQGIEIVMQKFYDINTMKTKYRVDTRWGLVNKQPEMTGIILFGQS